MNMDFFHRSPAELWDLVKQAFWRIFAPSAYATLYRRYQYLKNSAENEVRRLQRENRELQQRIDELTAQLQDLKE